MHDLVARAQIPATPQPAPGEPLPVAPSLVEPPPTERSLPQPQENAVISDYDAYAHEPPFRPRRNPARMWTAIAVALGLMLTAAIATVAWIGQARVSALVGLGPGEFDVPLVIMPRMLEPRTQANGNVLLPVSGVIRNPTDIAQTVPDILVECRDQQGRVVYSWTIPAPAKTVAARREVSFESATVNPPKSATKLKFLFVGTAR